MKNFAKYFFPWGVIAGMWVVSMLALADNIVTRQTAASLIDHGDWQRLTDGGFRYSVCGKTTYAEDGGIAALDAPCITCEPGAWNAAPATCVAAWRAANGL